MTACTTALAVRRDGIEPSMDIVARVHHLRALVERFVADVLDELQDIEDDARRCLGLLDTAHRRLDSAERCGDGFLQIASELPNGRQIAAVINGCIDALNDERRAAEHETAHQQLGFLFEAFGPTIFEQRFIYHVGVRRGLVLRREYEAWTAQHSASDTPSKEQAA